MTSNNYPFDVTILLNKNGKLNPKVKTIVSDTTEYKELIQRIFIETSFLDKSASLKERMYCLRSNIKDVVKCAYCGNPTNFEPANGRYNNTCSMTCKSKLTMSSPSYINPFAKDGAVEKIKKTKELKYGNPNYRNDVKRNSTLIEKYGVTNVSQIQEVKDKKAAKDTDEIKTARLAKMKSTIRERYGVDNMMQDPEFVNASNKKRYKHKPYKFKNGDIVTVIGYEDKGLSVLESEGYLYDDIKCSKISVNYILNETERRYYPDFVIEKDNRAIEIKSTYTIKSNRMMNKAKFDAASKIYDFEVWIFGDKDTVPKVIKWNDSMTIEQCLT